MHTFAAGGAGKEDEAECENEEEYEVNPEVLDICTGTDIIRDGCDVYYSCTDCVSGYVLVDTTWAGYRVSKCLEACTTVNCVSDSTWANGNTGYQYKTNRSCSDSTTCSTQIVYRCATGYYGTSTNGTSGCTRCLSSGGVYGTSIAGNNAAITKCYLPSGTSFSDSSGSGEYTADCYYTK